MAIVPIRMVSGKARQYIVSAIGQLSVFVAGAAYCWFEPITIRLEQDPELSFTTEDISWLLAIIEVGPVIASPIAGYLADRFGRKNAIMTVGPTCLVGWILIIFSKSMYSLIMARVLHGVALGVVCTATPIYAAEIAEPNLRGRTSGLFQITWYLGTLYSFCVGPYLDYDMFVYACLPLPVVFTILFIFVPETPYYLLMTMQEHEAERVLKYFRDGDVQEEFQDMQRAIKEEMSTKGSWKILFGNKVERKAFIVVQIVAIARYMTGMTTLLNYSLDSFSRTVFSQYAKETSILLAVLLTLAAVASAFMSDSVGRRPLLLFSCYGCFVGLFLVGGYFYIYEKTTIEASTYSWALYIGLAIFSIFTDIGVGPLLQTLQSEMFGASTRGLAGGITQGFVGLLSLVAIKMYAPINEAFGIYVNFWFFSLVSLVCGVLLTFLFIETAGKPIGQTEQSPIGIARTSN